MARAKVRVSRAGLCDAICRKIRITRRRPGYPSLTKRELLHVESFLNATVQELSDARVRSKSV